MLCTLDEQGKFYMFVWNKVKLILQEVVLLKEIFTFIDPLTIRCVMRMNLLQIWGCPLILLPSWQVDGH